MRRSDFESICQLTQKGREELVNHPDSHEQGRVVRCDDGHLVVDTDMGDRREWNFDECYEIHMHRDDFRYG